MARAHYEVVLATEAGERVLTHGIADLPDPTLQELKVGDGFYGFEVTFAPHLDEAERDRVFVRPCGGAPLEQAPFLSTRRPDAALPRMAGYVDERSSRHVAGWVWNEADPAERVPYEVVLQMPGGGERILAQGVAENWSSVLLKLGVGEAAYAFRVLFPEEVPDPQLLSVRVAETGAVLPFAPDLKDRFEPISHVALDTVNNCNLRCPFCVYDYSEVRTTHFMKEETFRSVLRLLPYVSKGNFWLSCTHEATLHPGLLRFIEMIPREHRDRLMYTTNLAKRMPDTYFAALGDSGIHHLSISLESLRVDLYERMRKGAKFHIFQENWAKLLQACRTGSAPPQLRYNLMAYRSNLEELPNLIEVLLTKKLAWQVEIRYTLDQSYIPHAFRETEYLSNEQWAWLAERLAHHDPSRVLLMLPPTGPKPPLSEQAMILSPASAPQASRPSYPLGIVLTWDGRMTVYSEVIGPDCVPRHTDHLASNILDIADPAEMIAGLLR